LDGRHAATSQGDEPGVRLAAESILNTLVGSQSPEYRDWDSDGQVTDPGDGFGLLLNGGNPGYIQALFAHADYAMASQDATQFMVKHGTEVKVCAQNIQQWATRLHDLSIDIIEAPAGAELEPSIEAVSSMARLMFEALTSMRTIRSIRLMANAIPLSADQAYAMADVSLLPGISGGANAGTQTMIARTLGPDGQSPTDKPRPTKKPQPTAKEAAPTKRTLPSA
jgi:hypothetical protein